jgi:hypothetical protein
MSCNLRRDQCCVTIRDGEHCLAPARELGGHCTRCFQALSSEQRAFLNWEASWTLGVPEQIAQLLADDWDIVAAAEAMLGD